MRNYKLTILGQCETKWTGAGQTKTSNRRGGAILRT
jgi:hypothetical protein